MAGGKVERWAIEAGTPNVLFRRGFTKQSLEAGTKIVVDGYRAKDGTRRANGRNLTFADGRTLFVGSSGTGAPGAMRIHDLQFTKLRIVNCELSMSTGA